MQRIEIDFYGPYKVYECRQRVARGTTRETDQPTERPQVICFTQYLIEGPRVRCFVGDRGIEDWRSRRLALQQARCLADAFAAGRDCERTAAAQALNPLPPPCGDGGCAVSR